MWKLWPVSSGVLTTMSIEGLSSPPSADQTSAKALSSGGGNAIVIGIGSPSSVNGPVSTSAGSASYFRKQSSRDDSNRCSSSGRCVQAVTR